jgi:hypothetical protein
MTTVTFHGFANGHEAFAEVMPHPTTGQIAHIAKKRGRLASKLILADFDFEDRGTIYAGDRAVARFTVSKLSYFLLPRT